MESETPSVVQEVDDDEVTETHEPEPEVSGLILNTCDLQIDIGVLLGYSNRSDRIFTNSIFVLYLVRNNLRQRN